MIWHPGWMTARYRNSFYISRSIYIINALLGAIGAKGGLPLANKPGDVGKKGLKKLVDLVPKPREPGPTAWAGATPTSTPAPACHLGLQGHGDRRPCTP